MSASACALPVLTIELPGTVLVDVRVAVDVRGVELDG